MIRKSSWLAITIALALGACSKSSEEATTGARTGGSEIVAEHVRVQDEDAPRAQAILQSAPNATLTGDAQFVPESDGVRAVVTIENAPPGKHGIHVHQRGDCSDIPGKSMGEHFAPAGDPHGLPDEALHHMGDMGNIEVTELGKGKLQITIKDAKLDDGPTSLLGKALVIHEKEDIGTGPSGESGTPIACGVIERE